MQALWSEIVSALSLNTVRRILHRDLKAKNIFLKNNLLKIGDFGVSCLLMGSCDLATTFTGTPYYMSPEALKHQGYNTKSDIW
ncbi:serine/threonine-protein kinase Nek11 [Grus japonensis]|uniref:non-specific serine/threonine protein kinase n=2 Tax=Grus TaxID=9114 RepID=A0ABC9WI55_GRUJA